MNLMWIDTSMKTVPEKVKAVVDSCVTIEHIIMAERYIDVATKYIRNRVRHINITSSNVTEFVEGHVQCVLETKLIERYKQDLIYKRMTLCATFCGSGET